MPILNEYTWAIKKKTHTNTPHYNIWLSKSNKRKKKKKPQKKKTNNNSSHNRQKKVDRLQNNDIYGYLWAQRILLLLLLLFAFIIIIVITTHYDKMNKYQNWYLIFRLEDRYTYILNSHSVLFCLLSVPHKILIFHSIANWKRKKNCISFERLIHVSYVL